MVRHRKALPSLCPDVHWMLSFLCRCRWTPGLQFFLVFSLIEGRLNESDLLAVAVANLFKWWCGLGPALIFREHGKHACCWVLVKCDCLLVELCNEKVFAARLSDRYGILKVGNDYTLLFML